MLSLAAPAVALVAALLSQVPASNAPTSAPVVEPKAVEIVRRYVEVTGGQAAYERVKTREIDANIVIPKLNLVAKVTLRAKAPDKAVSTREIAGSPAETIGFDGTTAWSKSGDKPAKKLTGMDLKSAKAQSGFNAALNVEKIYTTIRMAVPLPGDGLLDGKAVDRVELENDAESIIQTYDRATGLLVQSEQSGQTRLGKLQTLVTKYMDYREVDGIKYPHEVRTSTGTSSIEQKIVAIRHNVEIPDSAFEMPK